MQRADIFYPQLTYPARGSRAPQIKVEPTIARNTKTYPHKLGKRPGKRKKKRGNGRLLLQPNLQNLRNQSSKPRSPWTLPRLPVAPSEIGLACIGGWPARHLAIGLASSLSVDTAVCAPRVRLYRSFRANFAYDVQWVSLKYGPRFQI